MTTYALLVAIDRYLPPVSALYGCRNDSTALEEYLRARVGDELELETRRDAEATRAAVIEAFRAHLGRARAGDVALFAYAGHGSEEPAPAEIAGVESTGKLQTLVLYDCGRRIDGKLVRPLADKELAVLLSEVSATGAHTVVTFDCCHSGGADRDPFTNVRGWEPDPTFAEEADRDVVAELATARPITEFTAGTLEHWHAPRAQHVALAACQSFEKAKEHQVGGTTRGAFSTALIESLEVLGPRTTYRTLLNTVRARVERTTREQRPELFPLVTGSAGDGLFLDGAVTPVPSTFTMTKAAAGWQLDAGLVHGLRAPVGTDAFVLACTDPAGAPAGAVRVTAASVATSTVEPIGWEPEDVAYAAVVIDVPLPRAEVQLDPPGDGLEDATAAVHDAVRAAVATAGPGGAPSAHVRVVAEGEATPGALRLRIGVPAPGVARIMRADGRALTDDVRSGTDAPSDQPGFGEGAARLVVSRLEHIARWEQVRALGEHPSALSDAVTLHVYAAEPGEERRPTERAELPASGGYLLEYRRGPDGAWVPPSVYITLRNDSDDRLHVNVLDLTDRFKCRSLLDQTEVLAPGHEFALNGARPLAVRLPGKPDDPAPGTSARDWLQIIVSDVPFEAHAFDLPELDVPIEARTTRSATRGLLERLAAKAVSRDIGDDEPEPVVSRWAASTVTLEVAVPE